VRTSHSNVCSAAGLVFTGAIAELAIAEKKREALAKQVFTVLRLTSYPSFPGTYPPPPPKPLKCECARRHLLHSQSFVLCWQTVLEELRRTHDIPEGLSEAEVVSDQRDLCFLHTYYPPFPPLWGSM